MYLIRRLTVKIEYLTQLGIGFSAVGVAISYSDIYLFHIWFLFLGLLWFAQLKNSQYLFSINKRVDKYFLFLLSMFFWYGLSILWSPNTILSMKYLFYIFCGIIISFTIIRFSEDIDQLNKIYKTLSIVFIIEIIIALLESFNLFRWPISPYSSWSTFFGKETINYFNFENLAVFYDFAPPTGFHWNTNNLAITMILILPFFLCHKKILIKLIGSVCITIITVFAASRAVFLGLILVFCIYLLVIKKKIATLSLIWLLIIGMFLGMNSLKESENLRINEVANSLEALKLYINGDIDLTGSLEWRRELINNGLDALIDSKGLGLGAGGSTAMQEEMGGVAGRFTSMHNFWVEILVEGGIIFGVIGLFWYVNIIYNLFLISKNKLCSKTNFYAQTLFLSMIGFIPSAISASSTIYFFPMWIMFGMAISVILINKKNELININY